ncbi:MAG: hypothetical protein CM15mP1_1900 [Methanobacteriota archaeon]|nr:MAG: hypothetical protein CM15mP1_1900 [Euryarchaeota archaeon]
MAFSESGDLNKLAQWLRLVTYRMDGHGIPRTNHLEAIRVTGIGIET